MERKKGIGSKGKLLVIVTIIVVIATFFWHEARITKQERSLTNQSIVEQ